MSGPWVYFTASVRGIARNTVQRGLILQRFTDVNEHTATSRTVWGASCRTYNSYDTILTDSFRSTGVCDEGESFSGQSTRAGVHDKRASLVFAGNERCEYIQGEIHAARILSRVSGNCQPSQACCCRCTPVIHFSVVVCGYEFSTRHNPRQPSPRADCHRARYEIPAVAWQELAIGP